MTKAHELAAGFVAWCKTGGMKSLGTARAYEKALGRFIRDTGTADFADVAVVDLDAWIGRAILDGLSTATIRARIFALRTFWKYAVARGLLSKDPTSAIRVPAEDRDGGDVIAFSSAELKRLFDAALAQKPERGPKERAEFFERRLRMTAGQAERDHAILTVSFAAALRVSEAAALAWSDVLEPDGRDAGLAIIVRSSKRHKKPSRPVYLGAVASASLRRWRSVSRALGRSRRSVFGLSVAAISDVFDRCSRAAGVSRKLGRKVSFHALRSSRATACARAGMSDRSIARLLRHANVATVARYVREADETTTRFEQVASLDNPSLLHARRREKLASLVIRDSRRRAVTPLPGWRDGGPTSEDGSFSSGGHENRS